MAVVNSNIGGGSGGFDWTQLLSMFNKNQGSQGGQGGNMASGMFGAVEQTGQALEAIDALVKSKRPPMSQTIGLTSNTGQSLYSKGGHLYNGGGAMGYAQMGTTALELAQNAVQQAQIADTNDIKAGINRYKNQVVDTDNYDTLMQDWSNRADLNHITARDLRDKTWFGDFANSVTASAKGASAGQSAGPVGAVIGGIVGGVSSLAGSLIGRGKAEREARRVNEKIDIANARNKASYVNAAENIDTTQYQTLLANSAAFGGQLFSRGGGIHIKPGKRGTFIAAASKHGKSVQAFASQVLANKDNYSPAMVKKANFAKNASKWHAFGGDLLTNGAEWNNGFTYIGNGGSHEDNPHQGVQMGVDNQGIPNLVEEGETVYNDYVFSKRLKADGGLLDLMKLPKSQNGKSFADISKFLAKESEERPNDPISKRGFDDSLNKLQAAQEYIRQEQDNREEIQYAANGGKLNKFAEGGSKDKAPTLQEVLKNYNTGLRYAPLWGNIGALAQNIISKPDYTNAEAIAVAAEMAGKYSPITYNPLGNYLSYNPFDRNFYSNKLAAQANATRRAISNLSGGNRATAMANILAADYNAQEKLGNLYRQAEEYNLAQRQKVEEFNRATNQANSTMSLQAQQATAQARQAAMNARLHGIAQAATMKEAIDNARAQSIASNYSGLFENLGALGQDEYNRGTTDWLGQTGTLKTGGVDESATPVTAETRQKPDVVVRKPYPWETVVAANGGKINRKKRRGGLTY